MKSKYLFTFSFIKLQQWDLHLAEYRLQHCYLVVEGLNTKQNEPLPRSFARKLLIKNPRSVSENQCSTTKHIDIVFRPHTILKKLKIEGV